MKRKNLLIFSAILAFAIVFTAPACKTGEGCDYGMEEPNLDSNKKGKSNLFSKKTRKKMKKRGN